MAVDMFIKIGDIKGESKDDAHTDEIDVLGWTWGSTNTGTMHSGSGGGSGKANISNLNISKKIDCSTPNLLRLCWSGEHVNEATLTIRKAGGANPLEYLVYVFSKVLVTSVISNASENDDLISENVVLNFAECRIKYTPQADDGTAGAAVEAGYNIEANKII